MLIFTRNIGQQTIITLPDGTTVTVTSLEINGNQMRLGFTADKNVEIHREEVYARIQAEKKQKALQEQAA